MKTRRGPKATLGRAKAVAVASIKRRAGIAPVGHPGGGGARPHGQRLNELAALFPSLANGTKRFGVAVLLAVAQRWGATGELRYTRQEAMFVRPGLRPNTRLLDRADPVALARVLSGLAHPDRIRLARAVLAGANTHHLLIKAVQIKTGPLYHHLRELERAGVLLVIARNTYTLTEFGRTALFVTAALGVQPGDAAACPWKTKQITENCKAANSGDKASR